SDTYQRCITAAAWAPVMDPPARDGGETVTSDNSPSYRAPHCSPMPGPASLQAFPKPTRRYRIYMLRRISLVAASAAMVALSAVRASAANMASSTHKLSFPGLHGVKAWGTYKKVSKGVKVHVCAQDTSRSVFASGAVVVVYNSTRKLHTNLGAVAFGYHEQNCRDMTWLSPAQMRVYTFPATNKGTINHRSKTRNVY